MRIVLDAQFSPKIAEWIDHHAEIKATCVALRELGLHNSTDSEIFHRLSNPDDVVLTKDSDFFYLVSRLAPPPKVLWLRCGNRSNDELKVILLNTLPAAIDRLVSGDSVVEIKLEGSE